MLPLEASRRLEHERLDVDNVALGLLVFANGLMERLATRGPPP
jgi:hypothetical protein